MAGNAPEERVARVAVRQGWRRMSFLHWRVDPDVIRRHLPDALEPDVVDGAAWVGLTPFVVERFAILGAVPLPFGSTFPETNLRTYVRDRTGRDGLWFFSLDVPNSFNVAAGRMAAVPYRSSTMSVTEADGIRYRCRRRHGPPAGHHVVVRPTRPAPHEPSDLVSQLVGRWRAFIEVAGRLVVVPVEHEPWPLCEAELVRFDETITAAAAVPGPDGALLVHHSPGVDARLGFPRVVRRSRDGTVER